MRVVIARQCGSICVVLGERHTTEVFFGDLDKAPPVDDGSEGPLEVLLSFVHLPFQFSLGVVFRPCKACKVVILSSVGNDLLTEVGGWVFHVEEFGVVEPVDYTFVFSV